MAYDPNVYSVALVDESVTVALDDVGASGTAEVISLAEYVAAKVSDPGVNVTETPSVSESVSALPYNEISVNDLIAITESVDQDTGGEGATEVEDGTYTEESCGAAGVMSKAILPMKHPNSSGYMNISVAGTFTATVVLQRSFDRGTTWRTVASYTSATETSITDKEIGVRYRIGIPTTYTSGTADVRLGIGGQLL